MSQLKLPPIDPARDKLVREALAKEAAKDSPPPSIDKTLSIDNLMLAGLQNIRGIMKSITADVNTMTPSRNSVMNLVSVMAMLQALKEHEKDVLDNLSEDELKQVADSEEA